MPDLSLSNVYEISVSAPGAGVGEYNPSNSAVFTHEPYGPSFGDDGYKLFVDPADIATDFGSASLTAAMVNEIFSQRPNIRANGGYCVVIPILFNIDTLKFSLVPTAGTFIASINGQNSAPINWNDTAAAIQAKIRAIDDVFLNTTVEGNFTDGFAISTKGFYGGVVTATSANSLVATATPVVITAEETRVGETVAQAIVRANGIIHFFGLALTLELGQVELLATAGVLAPMRKIGFFLGSAEADIEVGGKLDLLRTGRFTNSRGLEYIDAPAKGIAYCAAYMGRALSTVFAGSNTTQSMHLKDLVGIQPDPTMTQTMLNKAQAAGADVYVSFRGVPKTFTSGKNDYFDNVYNILWFIEALQVAEFNTLAQVGGKIPQTEGGMDVLKGSARKVCEQARENGFIAPGEWTSPTTFGDQADFLDNIRQYGYYIYSSPIALQSVADREARKATLIQIAIKYAGAIHSGTILININK